MKLSEWITMRITKQKNRTAIREELAARSGVSIMTICHADNNMRIQRADKAQAISDATRGMVTLDDLIRVGDDPENTCVDCSEPINVRSKRCAACQKREHNRRALEHYHDKKKTTR